MCPPHQGCTMSCRVSSLSSQPVSRWLTSLSVQLTVNGRRLKRPGSVKALLHPAGCLAGIDVMKLRRLPVRSYSRWSARTRRRCRSAAGLHVVAGQVHVVAGQGMSMRLDRELAACAAAKSRNNMKAGSRCPLNKWYSPPGGIWFMSAHHWHR